MNKEIVEKDGVRYLKHGNSSQGAMYLDDEKIVSPFIRVAVERMNALPEGAKVLILGGGTFTAPRYARRDLNIDVVEIDPDMEELAKKHFGWEPRDNVRTIIHDAKSVFLSGKIEQHYDMIVVDLFDGVEVPGFATKGVFYQMIRNFTNVVLVNEYSVDTDAPYFYYGKWSIIVGLLVRGLDTNNYWVIRLLRND